MEKSAWEDMLENAPDQLTKEERMDWIGNMSDVALSSDAFFPFRDNIDRACQVRWEGVLEDRSLTINIGNYEFLFRVV